MTWQTAAGKERHMRKTLALLVAALALATIGAVVGGCSRSKSSQEQLPPGSISLVGAGSSFDAVLFNRWFTVYHESHPNVLIKYSSVGSGEGVRRFIGRNVTDEEKVDFGASDSAMSDVELSLTNNDTVMIPVTSACLVLAYNLPNFHGEIRLSRKAYSGIFLGEVKKWNDPLIAKSNPGVRLPDLTISIATRQDASGTTFAFTNNLSAISERWRSLFGPATLVNWPGNAMRAKGNEGVSGLIKNSEGSIGYVGYEFANRLGLDMAALENKEGKFVQPAEQSCMAGLASVDLPDNLRAFVPDPEGAGSYPIVTYSWVLLRKHYANPETARALHDLFQWSLQDGQRYSSQIGYVPIPSSVGERGLHALESLSSAVVAAEKNDHDPSLLQTLRSR
jgi:phosphate transport system substrate-binding protein